MPRRLVPRWESKRVQSSTDIWATSASVDNDLDSDIPAMSGFGSSSSTECGDDGRETEAAGRKGAVRCPDYHFSLPNGRSGVRFFHLKVRTPPFGDLD
jgi:hypothetical protein